MGVAHALLVGQAGPHHFSASFTVTETDDSAEIRVDVADRCVLPIEALAATYLIEASDAVLQHEAGVASMTWRNPDAGLTFEAEPPTQIAVNEASIGSIRLQALATVDTSLKTQRFQYRWRWIKGPS